MTRPDILVAVTLLASHTKNFTKYHIKAAKRVLQYLKGTKNLGLLIKKSETNFDWKNMEMVAHSDSDWGRDKIKRRSVTGYIIWLMDTPIVFKAKYQPTIALSSTEAEYMAISDC